MENIDFRICFSIRAAQFEGIFFLIIIVSVILKIKLFYYNSLSWFAMLVCRAAQFGQHFVTINK